MAHFKSGQDKPRGSGRKKGTPNKKSQLLEDILDANGFNIPEQLIKLLPNLSSDKQADILLDLMSYLYPKRKASDVLPSQNVDNTIEIIFVDPQDVKRSGDDVKSSSTT